MRIPFAVLAGVLGMGALSRIAALRRHQALLDDRPGLGDEGIVEGASALDLPAPSGVERSASRAVLVLHGFGDTPQSVAYLAGFLNGAGWAVRAPLLPGHGRTLRQFAQSGEREWVAHARAELALLRARHDQVAVVGQSMGGAIATILAADDAPPDALALLAPYFDMPDYVRRLARAWPLWGPFVPFVSSSSELSIHDDAERSLSLSYGAVSGRLLAELLRVVERARDCAPSVRVPVLVVQSRNDNRISAETAERGFARLGSARKRLVWVREGGHVLSVDRGRDRVFALVAAWLEAELERKQRAASIPA